MFSPSKQADPALCNVTLHDHESTRDNRRVLLHGLENTRKGFEEPRHLCSHQILERVPDLKQHKSLKKICDNNKIGAIKMEVFRNIPPKNNFLKKVRELASRKNIILIFDECTSGFRETFGGLHKKI